MAHWNFRLMALEGVSGTYLQINEVHYDEEGRLRGYSGTPAVVGGETLDEVRTDLERMLACLEKPILTPADFQSE